MPTLSPCPSCKRHLRKTEAVCPFCQVELSGAAGPIGRAAQSIAKAAVLAGSLAGAAACTGGDGDKPDAQQGQADAGPGPDAMPPLPYGAPPARKRIV